MLCKQCQTPIEHPSKFCPECGHSLQDTPTVPPSSFKTIEKKKMPFWFKLLITVTVLSLIGVTAGILFTERLVDVVDHHLNALQEGKIQKAYEDYTSSEFQSTTSLEEFTRFIENYPVFLNNQSSLFTERSFENRIGILKGNLTAQDKSQTPIEYRVIKEGKRWKILSIRLLKPQNILASKEVSKADRLIQVAKEQLELLQAQEVNRAYEEYFSDEFKEATSLEAFREFLEHHPLLTTYDVVSFHKEAIHQGIGSLSAILKNKNSSVSLKYYFNHTKEGWKIWSLRVLPTLTEEKEKKPSSLKLGEIIVGTHTDALGLIKNSSKTLSADMEDLYVDIEVKKGIKNFVIGLELHHIDSGTIISGKVMIEKEGPSLLISTFSAPPQGWPQGNYELTLLANPYTTQSIYFKID